MPLDAISMDHINSCLRDLHYAVHLHMGLAASNNDNIRGELDNLELLPT